MTLYFLHFCCRTINHQIICLIENILGEIYKTKDTIHCRRLICRYLLFSGAISPALSLSHASLAQQLLARGGVVGSSGVLAGGVLMDPAHQQAAAAAAHHAAHAHLVAGIHR